MGVRGDMTALRPRLPLTVIGGFLGAGKTTLLNRLLRDSQGRRLAVLVNDFGALNIDAELIAGTTGDTIALSNGCVCCSIGDDLTAALIGVIEAAEPFDAIVIEASGVADPWRIAQVALADPALGLDGVIVLVDASTCLAHAADPLLVDSFRRQLKSADLIAVNKIDLVDAGELRRVRAWLDAEAAATPRFETAQAEVPMTLLSSSALPFERASGQSDVEAPGHDHDHDHDHEHGDPEHGAVFDTWSCQPTQVFAADTLRAWLRAVPVGVLRLKGVLRTISAAGEPAWSELQFAGRHGSLRKASAPRNGAALVAIGLRGRLPSAALQSTFSPNCDD